MSDVIRISAEDTKHIVENGTGLLVCAYDDEVKCRSFHMDEAISLNEFRTKIPEISKDQEIVFFCA